jgi:hypothetical protein
MSNYPDTEGFGYSFERGELTANGRIWTAFSSIQADQPTEETAIRGTRPFPIGRTEGAQGMGEGTIAWSDETERVGFIESLGNGYRQKTWTLSWVLTAKGKPPIKKVAYGCRVLSEPVDDEAEGDAIGGDMTFSFMQMSVNGKFPHEGYPAPTQS